MSLTAGPVDRAHQADELLDGIQRGRNDHEFFWQFFLGRRPHPGQLQFLTESQATINALACSNRYGKTSLLPGVHYHACFYKTGAEARYLDEDGNIDLGEYTKVTYNTVHAAGEWEQSADVWNDAIRLHEENARLSAFIKASPKTLPPHIDFINGSRWRFRTLGNNASGVDGKSFYVISIDEAGWIADLEEMMNNVLRIRVADVRGRIIIVGTFKPGVSRDFYKIAVRASAYTGVGLSLDHRSDAEDLEGIETQSLDASIRRYAKQFGLDLDEFADAMKGE